MNCIERFVDTGKLLTTFADEVLVNCTGCGSPGVVRATRVPHKWNAHFECKKCGLKLDSAMGHWVGAVCLSGSRPCGYCGYKWLTPSIEYATRPEDPPTQISAKCPECGRETWVKASLTRLLPEDRCCDPHF